MKKTKLISLALLPMLFVSCSQEIENVNEESPESVNYEQSENPIQLVEKLENPYSVINMRKALDNLTGNGINASVSKLSGVSAAKMSVAEGVDSDDLITTTHYYIKFKPKTEEELDIIKQDTILFLFDAPLDYVMTEGDTYRDPDVPEGQPTYQYTYAKVDHALPQNVEYEILENLFIPEEEEDEEEDTNIVVPVEFGEEEIAFSSKMAKVTQSLTFKTEGVDVSILQALEEEALRLTNNLEEENTDPNDEKVTGWFRPSKWRPSGRITAYDDTANKRIGIKGVKVRIGNWFKWRTAFTDSKGNFSCGSRFRYFVRYKMDWERYHFALRDGFWNSAQKIGPYKRGSWKWDIGKGDRHGYYAHIFRAAYHFYYQDIEGLTRPPLNSFWKSQLRIWASRSQSDWLSSNYSHTRNNFWGTLSGVHLRAYGKETEDVYGTTIHELAHAVHSQIDEDAYKDLIDDYNVLEDEDDLTDKEKGARRVVETWATTVEIKLTSSVYEDYEKHQDFKISDRPIYTSLGYDLIDDVNQRDIKGRNTFPEDEVKNFTLKQVENSLKGTRSWDGWNENVKEQNAKEKTTKDVNTDNEIDDLFGNWN